VEERQLLAVAAGAEALSAHPLARAVVEGAQARGVVPLPAGELKAFHGRGFTAEVGGMPVYIGNEALFRHALDPVPPALPPALLERVRASHAQGLTTMIVAQGAQVLGFLTVEDTLRPEAPAAVKALSGLGIRRLVMLSGDQESVAVNMARRAGVDEVQAPLLPEEKLVAVRQLARAGGVAMVGDGVNDAPALATATVGISLGGVGSDAALETADVVLMSDNLARLPFALRLARATRAIIQQNLAISLGVSAMLIVASIMGWVRISHAVILHEGSTLLVVFNGLRLLSWNRAADRSS
jgi:Cd2+/Zn2+-exporting ATPase